MVTCRECESEINQATEICPHCGADLTSFADESSTPTKKPTLGKILLRWGMLLGVLLAALWSFLWFVVTPRTGNITAEAEGNAMAAIHESDLAPSSISSRQPTLDDVYLQLTGARLAEAA